MELAQPDTSAAASAPLAAGEFDALYRYLIAETRRCVRPPVDRFRFPWIAPMPLSLAAAAYLRRRRGHDGASPSRPEEALARPSTGDGFTAGDYSLGLFHHDASESAIELLRHPEFLDAVSGSLLCLLDCAEPSGRVHRAELSHKAREWEPSKPVIAQFAHRIIGALGTQGTAWAERHRVLPRVIRFIRYLEDEYTGLHGLMLTHSSLQSGFDSDIVTAGLPDKSVEGPDTNSLMVLEYRALAAMCRQLGRESDASEWEEKASALREKMERLLWYEDERGGGYVGLRWVHGVGSLEGEIIGTLDAEGKVRPTESWIMLLPLYAGIPSPERAKLVAKRLLDPDGYWGPCGVRTAPAHSPFFHQAARMMLFDRKKDTRGPVSNWSGPVWILPSYYLATGLAAYGFADQARELAVDWRGFPRATADASDRSHRSDYHGHMKPVGVAELKAQLSRYLHQVKAGREVIISERGLPIAKLVPLDFGELRVRREQLARAGSLRLGTGGVRKLLKSPPKGSRRYGQKVLAALLAERDEGR